MVKIRTLAIIFPLQLLCSLSAIAQKEEEVITLHFNWPAGLVAHVEQEWIRIKTSPDGADTLRFRSVNRLRTFSHPDGLLIRTDSLRLLDVDSGTSAASLLLLGKLITPARMFVPDFLVNSEGKFTRLDNPAQARATFDAILGSKFTPPGGEATIDSMFSAEQFTTIRSEEWNGIVGMWTGSKFKPGEAYDISSQQTTLMAPGITLPIKTRSLARERTGCDERAPKKQCLELHLASKIDSAAFVAYLASLEAKMGIPMPDNVRTLLNSLRVEGEAILLTDPATLLPYALTTIKRAGGYLEGTAAAKEGMYLQEEIHTYRFTYDKLP